MLAPLVIGIAAATPEEMVLQAPPASLWEIDVLALGGGEGWPATATTDTYGRAIGALRGVGAWSGKGDLRPLVLYGGDLRLWGGADALDSHRFDAELRPTRQAGGTLSVQGSGVLGWGEVMVAPTWAPAGNGAWARVRAGGGVRATPGLQAPVLGVEGVVNSPIRSALVVGGRASLRWYQHGALPATLSELDLGLSWQAPTHTRLSTLAGLSLAAGGAKTTSWVAGLPPAGAPQLRASLSAEQPLVGGLSVRVEARVDTTPGEWAAFGGMLGLRYHHAYTQPQRHDTRTLVEPGRIELQLVNEDAQRVEVMGTFTGWQPLSLTSDGEGRWRLALVVAPGVHEYVYVVDGEPVTPPECPVTRPDGFGGTNGVVRVPTPDP